ncbi:MAG TPA: hypothetical protein VLJ16_04230 [Acidobacteriota bacterium]|nr:hypothetical protein [Acidobacteriota bacterium]
MGNFARRLLAVALSVSFIVFPEALPAQNRRGATVAVTLKDLSEVSGELIAVKPDSLLLLSFVGKDESVPLADVDHITMRGKSKGGGGFLLGFLAGAAAGGVLASKQIREHRTEMPGFTAVVLPLLGGAVAGLVGLAVGSAARREDNIQIAGAGEEELARALTRLRKKARVAGLP